MKKISKIVSILALPALMFVSCSKSTDPTPASATEITSFKITSPEVKTGIIDASSKTIVFQPLAPKTAVNVVKVEIGLSSGATVSPASGSSVDFSKGPVQFTVTNGTNVAVYLVSVNALFVPTIAFVGDKSAAGSITEADTKAAYTYLSSVYGDTLSYIPFTSVNTDALKYIDVVFYYTDAEPGVEPGILDCIPASGKVSTVVDALKAFHAGGGRFLLAGLGTQYLNQLSRIPADGAKLYADNGWAPRIYGSGAGTEDTQPDQWGVNAKLNVNALTTVSTTDWDRSTHAIYAGLTTSNILNPAANTANPADGLYSTGQIYLLVSPGKKEDHNSMWDINAAPITDSQDAFDKADKWEAKMEAKVLGTWGHVQDLCCGAVVELNPRVATPNEGTIIAIGAAAYDWNQATNDNAFIGNVQKLTKNSIEYLRKK